jgi:[FeFe] hydrogenase H-cluster maturation GTPase HydF
LGQFAAKSQNKKVIVSDLIDVGDIVVLVTPIDESAPKGRLILPQQMTIRDILDAHGIVITVQPQELAQTLQTVRPRMVITDSQVFGQVSKIVPRDMALTSFSILMARYKGELDILKQGAQALSDLKDGDKVLISEGCTHHRQCNDIGTVKIPHWIEEYCGAKPDFSFTSGGEFPENLQEFRVIVHCGGCMLNEAEMKHRMEKAGVQGVLMVNYGMAIAAMHGILDRSLELFKKD